MLIKDPPKFAGITLAWLMDINILSKTLIDHTDYTFVKMAQWKVPL